MQKIRTYIVDSFSSKPFRGNPAAVCLPPAVLCEQTMLSIAAEFGLSETAFLLPVSAGNRFSIRYFSPKMEIPLCGHATLAAAKILFEERQSDQLCFETVDGIELMIGKNGNKLTMQFPEYQTTPCDVPNATLKALGIESVVNCEFNQETNILLLELGCCQQVKELAPDYEALIRSHDSVNGVLVSAPHEEGEYDFCSRYFWPWSGTSEDPVTGGTHTFLARYWGDRTGKSKMRSIQLSQRTGSMEVELSTDRNGGASVLITGEAFVFLRGEISI